MGEMVMDEAGIIGFLTMQWQTIVVSVASGGGFYLLLNTVIKLYAAQKSDSAKLAKESEKDLNDNVHRLNLLLTDAQKDWIGAERSATNLEAQNTILNERIAHMERQMSDMESQMAAMVRALTDLRDLVVSNGLPVPPTAQIIPLPADKN